MSIRDALSRKRRRLMLWFLLGLACCAAGFVAARFEPWFAVVSIAGFIFMFLIVLLLNFAIRCPACGGNVGYAITWPTTWDMSVSEKVRFCPFCGVSMDKEIKS